MELTIPSTPVAQAAADFAAEACAPFLLDHSYRTYHFGRMLVGPGELDEEVAFVASMLHDIGLTDDHGGTTSFELGGADVAARFLEARGWEPARIRLVETAIIRHTNLQPNEALEELVVQAGAALDVAAIPADAVEREDVGEILARHPRRDFVESMTAAYPAEIEAQPDGVFAQLEAAVELSKLIGAHPFDQRAAA